MASINLGPAGRLLDWCLQFSSKSHGDVKQQAPNGTAPQTDVRANQIINHQLSTITFLDSPIAIQINMKLCEKHFIPVA